MTKAARLATVFGFFLVTVGLLLWALSAWITPGVPGGTVDFTHTQAKGQPVHVTVQTFGSIGYGAHPNWVSYLVKDPHSGKWVQHLAWRLPANTVIDMTVYQYDSGSPLRNQEFGQVQGVIGGSATLNGASFSVTNSNTGNGVGHTFSVPSFRLSVPLVGVSASANVCGSAPCTKNFSHNIIKFSFKTPGPGSYNWQCIVPCGLGYLYGNGGPMSTQNFMGGELQVVNVS